MSSSTISTDSSLARRLWCWALQVTNQWKLFQDSQRVINMWFVKLQLQQHHNQPVRYPILKTNIPGNCFNFNLLDFLKQILVVTFLMKYEFYLYCKHISFCIFQTQALLEFQIY